LLQLRSKPITLFREVTLEDWLHYIVQGRLGYQVTHRRDPQWASFLRARLIDLDRKAAAFGGS
jgi:hypothetical protein